MNKRDFENFIHFAEINRMMQWAFEDVLNEYLTTKEVAESYEEYLNEASEANLEYERYCYDQMTLSPEGEKYLAKQLTGEIPIKNGNKFSIVNELYLSGLHVSEHFKTLYPKAWDILCYCIDKL